MSKVALSGNANGTGTFTIASPNSNSDRTLNLPDSAGTLATAESTLSQFNASGSAPVYAARAWVNFNGTGTVAIRASGNVSSITDNGTGNYTVNFTTAMADANYAVAPARQGGDIFVVATYDKISTSQLRIRTGYVSSSGDGTTDSDDVSVAIFR